ncbi:zf-TFIIB domain-containing protein [Halorussus lipolyticus]|uniref:TFIIB-type zinc ribbon-containing protein n=1 Tax=Halorussus lipolyticus TaxID=3034024 RepID=UPI0023E82768|nr:zf-TFIIB domain-containing protein [Halorussus sp. DT80]
MAHGRELDCLECGTELSQRREHGVTIDYCEDCGGVWLDPGELEALTGGKKHHKKHHDIDVDDVFEEDDEYDEYEDEQEEESGILGTIADALGGGEEEEGWGEDEEFEEEEDWGGEAEFEEDF